MSKSRYPVWCFSVALALSAAQVGCGEDEPLEPEVCEEESGYSCVWAGETGRLGFNGDGHHRLDSVLYWPIDLAFAPDGTPYVLDWQNHAVRQVQPDQTLRTMVGEITGFPGDGWDNDPLADQAWPGVDGATVRLNHPTDLGFLSDGTVLVMAWHNHKLRTLNPDTGNVWVMCGHLPGFAGDGEPAATTVRFNQPSSLAVTPEGSIYILDQRNFRIRKISGGSEPLVSTVVGAGVAGFAGDGGDPLEAELRFEAGGNPEPSGSLALAPDGRLYIADSRNHRIRRVDFAANEIETVAGNGAAGYGGDGGAALEASLNDPRDIEIGPDGNLYIADTENHRIRMVDLETGIISTVAGTGVQGDHGRGKTLATELELDRPFGIAFDHDGHLYIADSYNSRILKVTR